MYGTKQGGSTHQVQGDHLGVDRVTPARSAAYARVAAMDGGWAVEKEGVFTHTVDNDVHISSRFEAVVTSRRVAGGMAEPEHLVRFRRSYIAGSRAGSPTGGAGIGKPAAWVPPGSG